VRRGLQTPARAIEGLRDMLLDEGAKRDAVESLLEVLKAVPEAAGMGGPFGMRVRQALGLTGDDLRVAAQTSVSGL
jgi:hypothetical protein